jgi:hypothetical protein
MYFNMFILHMCTKLLINEQTNTQNDKDRKATSTAPFGENNEPTTVLAGKQGSTVPVSSQSTLIL